MSEFYDAAIEIRDQLAANNKTAEEIAHTLVKINSALGRIAESLATLSECVSLKDPVFRVRHMEKSPR